MNEFKNEDGKMASALNQYRQGCQADLPAGGLDRLQKSVSLSQKPRWQPHYLRYASAAMLALVFFASGFWSGRNSTDQPLPMALHLPRQITPGESIPALARPSFTVALAESIPGVFSIPH